jgi:methyltransferase (TIGR00027 family)
MPESAIAHVSDTAFWIAHLRAIETQRSDALVRDRLAARLAGERGRQIAASIPMSQVVGWTVALRTLIIDEYIELALREGVDTVLNLGAGLDTRPYRMKLPESLTWIEADYPQIIEYKNSLLIGERVACKLESVRIDLADLSARRGLFAAVNARAKRLLVLTEGVVPYLTNEQAASLADDLRTLDRVHGWVVDYLEPGFARYRRRSRLQRAMQNAPFRFAPADWHAFFEAHGWRARKIRYIAEEAERLNRPIPLPVWMRAVVIARMLIASAARRQAFRRFLGYALLEPR